VNAIESLVMSRTFAAFMVASLILALTPGPGVLYIVTRTLGHGRKAGLASVYGVALGNLANASVAAVGLAAVLSTSSTAFTLVKLAGALYLILLGIKTLRARPAAHELERPDSVSPVGAFRDGFMVALLNPKTALFFAALLPQFITSRAVAFDQSLILGCVFVFIAMCTDTMYALSASMLAGSIVRGSMWRPLGRYVSGVALIGLGVSAALVSPRSAK
jgi:threonine/homoserine/homoserine lactone efflux protein